MFAGGLATCQSGVIQISFNRMTGLLRRFVGLTQLPVMLELVTIIGDTGVRVIFSKVILTDIVRIFNWRGLRSNGPFHLGQGIHFKWTIATTCLSSNCQEMFFQIEGHDDTGQFLGQDLHEVQLQPLFAAHFWGRKCHSRCTVQIPVC